MFGKLLAGTSILAVAAIANAAVTNVEMVHVFEGNLCWSGFYVSSWDLMVTIEGDDAWTVGAGPAVGEPWIVIDPVHGGTFFQDPAGGDTPTVPPFPPPCPDLEWDTYYTTHLGWPNVETQGIPPSFAYGPINEPTQLTADWFWTPDGNYYPGTFTIARVTVIPDNPELWWADVTVQVASLETVPPILFTTRFGIPEPASLAPLALGLLALLPRRWEGASASG